MKKLLIGALVVAVLAAIVIASLKSDGRRKGTRVYTTEVTRADIARTVKASGQIDPRVKVNISAHVIGKIERLFVEEGDEIEAGQPFLELEKEAFTAARDQAAAQTAIARSRKQQARISLEDATLKLRRMERLNGDGIASAEQLEAARLQETSARLSLEQAEEAVIQARAALDKATDDLEKTTIYAPLTGRVVDLNAEQGEVVVSGTMNNPASVIGTIADLSEILAEVDVDETEVAYLAVGQRAELRVDALPEHTFRGEVVEIGSSGFQRPQQPDVTFFKVKILLAEPDENLRPGMSVRAEVETARHEQVLVVPIQAVVQRPPLETEDGEDDEISVVFVIADEQAEQRPVESGLTDAIYAEIASGLEEGEVIVTGPYRSLKGLEHEDRVRARSEGEQEDDEEEDD